MTIKMKIEHYLKIDPSHSITCHLILASLANITNPFNFMLCGVMPILDGIPSCNRHDFVKDMGQRLFHGRICSATERRHIKTNENWYLYQAIKIDKVPIELDYWMSEQQYDIFSIVMKQRIRTTCFKFGH